MGTRQNPDARDVKDAWDVADDFPEQTSQRKSDLRAKVEKIKADVDGGELKSGAAVMIRSYAKPTAASAAANVLRKFFGKPDEGPWTFATRKSTDDTGRTNLWVKYDPAKAAKAQAPEAVKEAPKPVSPKQTSTR